MKNEIGNRYGKLVVIARAERPEGKPKGAYWLCQCDCGNQKVVRGAALREGGTRSCGCLYGQHSIKNEIGNRYGRLTVLKQSDRRSNGAVMWECQCDCGNVVTVSGANLRAGITKSCGCYMIDRTKEANTLDISGMRFGFLVAESRNEEKSKQMGRSYWDCLCDCGKHTTVSSASLMAGHTKSCGCLATSYGEAVIEKLLTEHKVNFKREYTFDDLVSARGGIPRFDFVILNDNNQPTKIIEYDGIQHFQPVEKFGGQEGFLQRQENDKLKTQYCEEHHIPLLRIPYTQDLSTLTIEDLLNEQLSQ